MPDLNGWDVVKAVKESHAKTPVLVLTGWGDNAEAPNGVKPDGFLTKPFDLKRLAAEVGSTLARG
jgi:DNA-binding response OmpR family regulator